jgi:hypothetical protein
MAALTGNVTPAPYYDPGFPIGERYYPVEAADEFYRGAILCFSSGLVVADNADADTGLGVCTKRVTTTAANQVVMVATHGVWWFAAVALTTASLWTLMSPLATSDNPADMTPSTGAVPSPIGTVVHCDVTATSGWVDQTQRVVPANT